MGWPIFAQKARFLRGIKIHKTREGLNERAFCLHVTDRQALTVTFRDALQLGTGPQGA